MIDVERESSFLDALGASGKFTVVCIAVTPIEFEKKVTPECRSSV